MCGSTCDSPPSADPGESELGEAPFTRGLDSLFERLQEALGSWRPFFDALRTLFGWIVAPVALLVWISTPVALALAYALEGIYTLVSLVPAPPCTSMILLAAIVLLVLLRLSMLWLQMRGQRSRVIMSLVGPEMQELKEQHKNDRDKLQREMMELYRRQRANPLTGCLVGIVMVLFAASAWRMLKGLAVKGETGMFDPDFLHEGSHLRTYLTGVDTIDSWGMDLLVTVGEVGFCTALIPYAVVHLVSLVLIVAQTRSSLNETKHLPNMKYILLTMMYMSIAAMVLLPMFFVILKIVDSAQMWIQTSYVNRRVPLKLARSRDDADLQRNVGENVADEMLGRAERRHRPNPMDGDDLSSR